MYIVTGASGFIGSVIIAELNNHKSETPVVAVDWMEDDARWKNLRNKNLADIVDPKMLGEFLAKNAEEITAIIHMGAISSTTETDGDILMDRNFRPSLDLFRWCAEHHKPYIYASSAATYGDGSAGFDDREDRDYLKILKPLNPYGFSKHAADKAIIQSVDKPPQWVGLKFFNVYGPNEYHKGRMQSVVRQTFNQINETGKMKLFKSYHPNFRDGEQQRDFVYVKDIAKAILWFLDNPDVSGIFNIGTGEARTFNNLAKATFAALGKEPNIEYIDMPEDIKNQYQYHTEANMEKFFEVFEKHSGGERFEFSSLEDGVADYVNEHLVKDDPVL